MPATLCKICNTRKAKRCCPALPGDICPICCGEAREVTLDCPLPCPYLQDAYHHERLPDLQAADVPYPAIKISPEFLDSHDILNVYLSKLLLQVATVIPKVYDSQVRDALDALIQERLDEHPEANDKKAPEDERTALLCEALRGSIADGRATMTSERGQQLFAETAVRDMLIFLRRSAFNEDNGRPLGRAFLGFLAVQFPELSEPEDIK